MKSWPISLLLLPLSLIAHAATPGPITIEAERMELDQAKGTSTYRGNVVLTRDALRLYGDTLTLYTVKKKLQRVVTTGTPARLDQAATAGGGAVHAEADWLEYLPPQQQVLLKGHALLLREGNEMSGEQISYDLEQQLVKASGDDGGSGRVKVILQPQEEDTPQGEKP